MTCRSGSSSRCAAGRGCTGWRAAAFARGGDEVVLLGVCSSDDERLLESLLTLYSTAAVDGDEGANAGEAVAG